MMFLLFLKLLLLNTPKLGAREKEERVQTGSTSNRLDYIPSPTEGLRAPGPTTGTPGYNHKNKNKKIKNKKEREEYDAEDKGLSTYHITNKVLK